MWLNDTLKKNKQKEAKVFLGIRCATRIVSVMFPRLAQKTGDRLRKIVDGRKLVAQLVSNVAQSKLVYRFVALGAKAKRTRIPFRCKPPSY